MVRQNEVGKMYYRITGWLRLEGTSGGHLIQPPAHAGPPSAGCPEYIGNLYLGLDPELQNTGVGPKSAVLEYSCRAVTL